MDQTLARFLRTHYAEHPAAVTPVKAIVDEFRASGVALEDWPRGRIVAELIEAGYTVGRVGRVAHVAGLAPRHIEWRAVGGRLEAAHV
jgi:hypothetical protein